MTLHVTAAVWNQRNKPNASGMLVMLALSDSADDEGQFETVAFEHLSERTGMRLSKIMRTLQELAADNKIGIPPGCWKPTGISGLFLVDRL